MNTEVLNFEEGLELFNSSQAKDLQERAIHIRNTKNSPEKVSYVVDTNPNYTNVCLADCLFCAFYRRPNDKDSYTYNLEEVRKFFITAKENNASTVLLQGGLHPELHLSYYTDIIKMCKEEFPNITPHFFSAPEIQNIAEVNNLSIKKVLEAFYAAGQRSLPGGGAEILSQKVRNKISPKKQAVSKWLEIHETAHNIGMKSTATMMYGHKEEPEHILEHLEAIRQIQERTHGFTAFIPWSYKKDNTLLGRKTIKESTKEDYFKILSFSRIYLHNFDHIQASWFSEGKETGIEALQYGADDFGGTLFEENVHAETGFINKTSTKELKQMIKQANFTPIERDPLYNYFI